MPQAICQQLFVDSSGFSALFAEVLLLLFLGSQGGPQAVKKLSFFDGGNPPSEILRNFRAKAGRGMHFQPQIEDLLL